MSFVRNSERIPENMRGTVIALGNFDGVHLGHQAVLLFDPNPRDYFGIDKKFSYGRESVCF